RCRNRSQPRSPTPPNRRLPNRRLPNRRLSIQLEKTAPLFSPRAQRSLAHPRRKALRSRQRASPTLRENRTFVDQRRPMATSQMIDLDELKRLVRRNKLLGMRAAEKLGLAGRDAEAYGDDLAVGTLDAECSDVLNKIRKDFDAAGVVQSDEQILEVMNEL